MNNILKISQRTLCNQHLNLKLFLKNNKLVNDKAFWHIHKSNNFIASTLTNKLINSKNENSKKKQLFNSILKNNQFPLNDCFNLPISNKLFLIDSYLIVKGNRDEALLSNFNEIFSQENEIDIFEIIHLLYLISILNNGNYKLLLDKLINKIQVNFDEFKNKINSSDLAVLCLSLFRLKYKFRTSFLFEEISKFVQNDIKSSKLEQYHVVSLIKFMRQNHHYNQDFIDSIVIYIKNNYEKFTFLLCAHFLAFFANLSYYQIDTLKLLVDIHASKLLKSSTPIRSKDISRFLWSLAHLNYDLPDEIKPFIITRLNPLLSDDFKKYPHFLIDSLKSLVIMGIYEKDLFEKVLNSKGFLNAIKDSERDKVSSDLYFILESISIECPSISLKLRSMLYSQAKILSRNIHTDIQRPILKMFVNELKENQEFKGKIGYALQHIKIASIFLDDISYEIIDSFTCLRNIERFNGLMKTKLRQMKILDKNYQLIKSNDDLTKLFKKV